MFRSLFNKLRAIFWRAKANASERDSDSENQAAPTSAAELDSGLENDTPLDPLEVRAARKRLVSAPLPIPSLSSDPVEDESAFDNKHVAIAAERAEATELPEAAINPIAAASAPSLGAAAADQLETELETAPQVEAEPVAAAGAVFELDTEPIPDLPVISAEALCDIDPESMDREQIRTKLAVLYRRYNAVASSLNAEMRAEAELMLDAIVACREAYVDHL